MNISFFLSLPQRIWTYKTKNKYYLSFQCIFLLVLCLLPQPLLDDMILGPLGSPGLKDCNHNHVACHKKNYKTLDLITLMLDEQNLSL